MIIYWKEYILQPNIIYSSWYLYIWLIQNYNNTQNNILSNKRKLSSTWTSGEFFHPGLNLQKLQELQKLSSARWIMIRSPNGSGRQFADSKRRTLARGSREFSIASSIMETLRLTNLVLFNHPVWLKREKSQPAYAMARETRSGHGFPMRNPRNYHHTTNDAQRWLLVSRSHFWKITGYSWRRDVFGCRKLKAWDPTGTRTDEQIACFGSARAFFSDCFSFSTFSFFYSGGYGGTVVYKYPRLLRNGGIFRFNTLPTVNLLIA